VLGEWYLTPVSYEGGVNRRIFDEIENSDQRLQQLCDVQYWHSHEFTHRRARAVRCISGTCAKRRCLQTLARRTTHEHANSAAAPSFISTLPSFGRFFFGGGGAPLANNCCAGHDLGFSRIDSVSDGCCRPARAQALGLLDFPDAVYPWILSISDVAHWAVVGHGDGMVFISDRPKAQSGDEQARH
jgi:hypothetical protein